MSGLSEMLPLMCRGSFISGTEFTVDELPHNLLHPVPNLVYLSFSGTTVRSIKTVPDMSKLNKLEVLFFNNNPDLTHIAPASIEGATSLRTVCLQPYFLGARPLNPEFTCANFHDGMWHE